LSLLLRHWRDHAWRRLMTSDERKAYRARAIASWPETMTCRACGCSKPRSEFSRGGNPANPDCKACHRPRWKKHDEKRKARSTHGIREDRLKRVFGLPIGAYDRMVLAQRGLCALCGSNSPNGKTAWQVDHDHVTGRIRGLLCTRCNHFMAYLDERGPIEFIAFIEKAIAYASSTTDWRCV